jgi:hypothetical protein
MAIFCVLLLAASACGGQAQSPPPATSPAPPPVEAKTHPATPPGGTAPDTLMRTARPSTYAPPDTVPLPWRPPDTGPSREAQRVLDTLPEPRAIGLPSGLPQGTITSAAPATPRSSNHLCYEIQLMGTSNEAGAHEAARRAEASLGVPVYVVWENGLHKVRAGGCLTRADAEVLRDRARAGSYPEAFLTESAPK